MIIVEDICPKTNLKRKIDFVSIQDFVNDSKIIITYNIEYYNNLNVFLGINILGTESKLTLTNENVINGIGEYTYWKSHLNDFQALINKGINSYDACVNYVIMKNYLDNKIQ